MNKTEQREKQLHIYRLIAKNPGIHSSKIAELMNMHISIIEQLLRYLEHNRIVNVVEDLGYKRYYVEKIKVGTRVESTLEIQENIYRLIEKNPGIHMSKIAEILEMRISHVEYHLIQMEHNKKVIGMKDEKGYFKRYYTEDSELGIENKKLLALLRQEIPSTIIALLLKHNYMQHKELLHYVEIGPSTLSYHLKKLVKKNILEVKTFGKDKGYSLKNKKEMRDL